jgi:hypothetical protein
VVTVPPALVNKGFEVLVGAHSFDHSKREPIRRFYRMSKSFPITSATTKIANSFGGGVYIVSPYKAKEGLVEVTLSNVVPAPLFSATTAKQTSLEEWVSQQRRHPAPWADFVSDKFMMQVPTSWIYNYEDPVTLMKDWDNRMDAVSEFLGYPLKRHNVSLYLTVDIVMNHGVYGIGFPQVIHTYNPKAKTDGNANHLFLRPGKAGVWHTEYHEMGHAHAMGTYGFPGHVEAENNILTAYILNTRYDVELDTAFASAAYGKFGRDQAVITRMVTPNFRAGKPMDISNSTKHEVRYQQCGFAYMADIAALFGWKAWSDFHYQQHLDYMAKKPSDGLSPVDSRILRLSKAADADLRPLIHFWGVHPTDPVKLSDALQAAGLKPSAKIYDRLQHYQTIIPKNNDQFREHAKVVETSAFKAESATKDPNFGPGWYYVWLPKYDETHGNAALATMQNILKQYFPRGRS